MYMYRCMRIYTLCYIHKKSQQLQVVYIQPFPSEKPFFAVRQHRVPLYISAYACIMSSTPFPVKSAQNETPVARQLRVDQFFRQSSNGTVFLQFYIQWCVKKGFACGPCLYNEPHMCVAKNLFPETKYQTVGTFFQATRVTRGLKIYHHLR